MNLSPQEQGIIEAVRFNKTLPLKGFRKQFQLKRLHVIFQYQSKDNLWGRFGGGWNWKVGFQIGGSTLIVDLLVCSFRFWIE